MARRPRRNPRGRRAPLLPQPARRHPRRVADGRLPPAVHQPGASAAAPGSAEFIPHEEARPMGGALRDEHRPRWGWTIGGRTEVRAPRVPFALAHARRRRTPQPLNPRPRTLLRNTEHEQTFPSPLPPPGCQCLAHPRQPLGARNSFRTRRPGRWVARCAMSIDRGGAGPLAGGLKSALPGCRSRLRHGRGAARCMRPPGWFGRRAACTAHPSAPPGAMVLGHGVHPVDQGSAESSSSASAGGPPAL